MATMRHGFGLRFTTQPKGEITESKDPKGLREIRESIEAASIFRGPPQELMGMIATREAGIASASRLSGHSLEDIMRAAAAKIQSEIDSGAIGAKRK